MTSAETLSDRLTRSWRANVWTRPGERVAVACSGGADSLTLLHLLRFSLHDLELRVEAVYFDHRMREDGEEEAAWIRGVASAWETPLHVGRAPEIPRTEGAARSLRYAYLEGLIRSGTVGKVLTAHHADDQVETILFRVLRGTGLEGLRGIPVHRPPGILRPLLEYSRSDLQAYAARWTVPHREDPSNRSTAFARNRVRHHLLPHLEDVHPGAGQGLLRLSRNASRVSDLLEVLVRPRWETVLVEASEDRVVLHRDRLLSEPEPVQSELVRRASRALGTNSSEAGTATALEFITRGLSGTGVDLPGALRLGRNFDHFVLQRTSTGGHDRNVAGDPVQVEIRAPEAGQGVVVLAGHRWHVCWGPANPEVVPSAARSPDAGWYSARFDLDALRFPLRLRSWHQGDRTQTTGGGKKLKKLFGELRVPVAERNNHPLLVDAQGCVLWIPGLHKVPGVEGRGSTSGWVVEVGPGVGA